MTGVPSCQRNTDPILASLRKDVETMITSRGIEPDAASDLLGFLDEMTSEVWLYRQRK
jgi:hypothetical protein